MFEAFVRNQLGILDISYNDIIIEDEKKERKSEDIKGKEIKKNK